MSPKPIYLDYNATTPLLPEVVEAMLPYLTTHFGNPSSAHIYGQEPKRAVAHARECVAELIGCDADEILFTSGGTEANNLAIHGVAEARVDRPCIVTTVIEHPATAQPCNALQACGRRIVLIGVDADGRADVESARREIGSDVALVTLMHSNNETGVLQPVNEFARLARAAGAFIHTDAAQSLGKVPVRVHELDVDLLSIAGHKLYAPKGIGALYVRRGTPLAPWTRGANQERGLRPGTENVASIVALGAACAAVARDLAEAAARMRSLRDRLEQRLAASIPGLALNGHRELRLPNTLNVRFPHCTGSAVLTAADTVAASTGSACHSGEVTAPAVILAMGVPQVEALGSVRLSLGRGTTQSDIDAAADALIAAWHCASGEA
ncbi:cysteine desulfurase family protein [Dyella choica]|uniref:cysteine desulfurase n=1 Tax=Dyella choica TaxID=1927959 RepID=A0A432M5H2_9GAMM|nr:aminotransferase class V-fold PLP-dependent enzyme [Dyella choica]RUL75220.1 aminotransferase class V-fold PLP-dependent enzyme [Dyella choica]